MKKFLYFIPAALSVIAAFSCTKPEITGPMSQEEAEFVPFKLNANSEESDTKSFIGGENLKSVLWEDGDQIALFTQTGTQSNVLTLETGAGSTAASFSGLVPAGATPLLAVYPADAAVAAEEDDVLTISLPAVQTISVNNTAKGALVSVGKPSDTSTRFKNVFGIMKVSIADDNITSVVISGKNLAGSVKVNAGTGAIREVVATSGSVTLLPSSEVFTPGDYYIAVLPGTTPEGEFSVVLGTQGESALEGVPAGWIATVQREITIPRCGGFKFSDQSTSFEEAYFITTKDQLYAWNNGAWKASDKVLLGADIDMAQDASWKLKGFAGTFDGLGHKICNMNISAEKTNAGFIALNANGILKNTVFGSRNGSEYDGVSVISYNHPDPQGTFGYAGIVTYLGNGAKVINVTNFATITTGEASVNHARIGGIAGGATASTTTLIEGCRNYGSVNYASNVTQQAVANEAVAASNGNMGGILAYSDGAITIRDCENHGTVTTANNTVNRVAGILGGTTQGVVLDNCDNFGSVSMTRAVNQTNWIAGIVANLNGDGACVTGCDNTGEISITDENGISTAQAILGGIAGAVSKCATFENNTNNAKVVNHNINTHNSKTGGVIAGGIIGYLSCALTVNNCNVIWANGNTVDDFSSTVTSGTTFSASNTSQYIKIGGIVGQVTAAATIQNCKNSGLTQKIGRGCYNVFAGGIVGYNATAACSIKDCINERYVGITQNVYMNANLGGILGYAEGVGTAISGCQSKSSVTIGQTATEASQRVNRYFYVGGIVGRYDAEGLIENCTNDSKITSTGKTIYWDGSAWKGTGDGYRAGGIVGASNAGSGKTLTIRACANKGSVECATAKLTQNHNLGGILGCATGGNMVIENCITTGNVSSTGTNARLKAVCGYFNAAAHSVSNTGVAGTIGSTELTAANFNDNSGAAYLWTLGSGKSVSTSIANYFYNGTPQGTSILSFVERSDSNRW